MGVRLNDTAVVLVPNAAVDKYTGQPISAAWEAPPTQVPTAFQGEPVLARGVTLEDDAVLAKWRGYLPPAMQGIVTPACRIIWAGITYAVDGPVGEHRRRGRVRYLSVTLKLVKSGATP